MNILEQTKPVTSIQDIDYQPDTRYETSLAEFPIFLLHNQKTADLDNITYHDTIMVNQKPVERTWKVTWSKKYGPGTLSTSQTFFALFQIWAETGFISPRIHFGSVNAFLKRRGLSDGQDNHQRIIADLHCLCNIYIEAKNAFFDTEKKKYVDAGFHLFESVWLEKDSEGNPDPSTKGTIEASKLLYASVQKNCFLLGVDEKDFFDLPGIQQRLYLYLKKIFIFQKIHTRNIMDLARQLPLFSTEKKKVKQQLKQAAEGLMKSGILPVFAGYKFFKSEASGHELIRFEKIDAKQLDLFKGNPPAVPATPPDAEVESAYLAIADACKDKHSFPFYKKVSELMPPDLIYQALSEAKDFSKNCGRDGTFISIPKVFTSRINSLARHHGIEL